MDDQHLGPLGGGAARPTTSSGSSSRCGCSTRTSTTTRTSRPSTRRATPPACACCGSAPGPAPSTVPPSLDPLYAELGARTWEQPSAAGTTCPAGCRSCSPRSCPPPACRRELADALDDTSWDDEIRAETDAALALTGKDVGTPVLHFQPPDGVAFFGPVISRRPSDDEAVALWDHVVGLASFAGFAELKRSLRELPQLPALGVAAGRGRRGRRTGTVAAAGRSGSARRPERAGLAGALLLPHRDVPPLQAVLRRVVVSLLLLALVVVVVYLDRAGYSDTDGNGVGLLDALYYATVSLSTTGYGDIAPITPQARLVNVLLVTPLRVLFLIVLVGTTLEVLTERTRQQFRNRRWRQRVRKHTVVVGYGTKGRSAVRALLVDGYPQELIVVVDPDPVAVAEATQAGLVTVLGDATRRAVLEQAEVGRADRVLVSSNRDDTAVLVVLTVRQLNSRAPIVASVREAENAPLVRQSGATSVVVSSEAAGRLLAVSASSPASGKVLEDLLIPHTGLEVDEREVTQDEVGRSCRQVPELVLAVLRGRETFRFGAAEAVQLEPGDRLVVVRDTGVPEDGQVQEPEDTHDPVGSASDVRRG